MTSDVIKRSFPTTPEEWEALIAEAPGDDTPLDPEEERRFWENAVIVYEGGPDAVRAALAVKRRAGPRGKQKAPTKQRITLRLSPDVLAHFRATGKGWQTRMDAALREWIARQ